MAKKQPKILSLRNGYWSKQINRKVYYFGKDYDKAVEQYFAEKQFHEAGLPVPSGLGNSLGDLLNDFLSNRHDALESGSIVQRTYDDYVEVCDLISAALPVSTSLQSLTAFQFDAVRKELEKGKRKKVGIKTLDRRLGYARAVFRFASTDNRLIDRQLPFQSALKSIPKREMRRHKNKQPPRLLTPEEIRAVLSVASSHLKAMILLSVNGGLNNSDIANLELAKFKKMPDVLTYPRHKTSFMRVVPLWAETKQAIAESIESRPKSSLPNLFISPVQKRPFYDYNRHDQISKSFYRHLNSLKIYEPGKNFGALRTTFAEVGKEVGDDLALKALMGHADGSSLYEEYARGVYVPRLKKITSHIHSWLFSNA